MRFEGSAQESKDTMKRIGNLYQKIISVENLRLADEKARKGKLRSYGVRAHDMNRDANIEALHEMLKAHTYKTSAYSTFTVHEPKERLIFRLPYYPDRIVHHAVMNVLKPIWMGVFTADSYSCIEGRGIDGCRRAVRRAMDTAMAGTRYCLKFDIRKFYPSIDHDVLKAIVRRKIKDAELLWLLDGIIDSAPGVPIGNYLSQYFANLYMTYFDHWLKEELHVRHYFRYADDCVILSDSKERLHEVQRLCDDYLRNELKLEMKGDWQVFPVAENRKDGHGRGIDFVGFVFFRRQTRMRKRIKRTFCRAVAALNVRDIADRAYKMRIASWLGWAKYSDSEYLLNKILKHRIYEKIRKQCKAAGA